MSPWIRGGTRRMPHLQCDPFHGGPASQGHRGNGRRRPATPARARDGGHPKRRLRAAAAAASGDFNGCPASRATIEKAGGARDARARNGGNLSGGFEPRRRWPGGDRRPPPPMEVFWKCPSAAISKCRTSPCLQDSLETTLPTRGRRSPAGTPCLFQCREGSCLLSRPRAWRRDGRRFTVAAAL